MSKVHPLLKRNVKRKSNWKLAFDVAEFNRQQALVALRQERRRGDRLGDCLDEADAELKLLRAACERVLHDWDRSHCRGLQPLDSAVKELRKVLKKVR